MKSQNVLKNCRYSNWTAQYDDMELQLKLYPYKPQLHQEMNDFKKQNKVQLARSGRIDLRNNPDFFQPVVFSNECRFLVSGLLNQQNPSDMGLGPSR